VCSISVRTCHLKRILYFKLPVHASQASSLCHQLVGPGMSLGSFLFRSHSRNKNVNSLFLIKLFAKITKHGWFDVLAKENTGTYSFREILQDISKFIQV
jgi:hypothetical protein